MTLIMAIPINMTIRLWEIRFERVGKLNDDNTNNIRSKKTRSESEGSNLSSGVRDSGEVAGGRGLTAGPFPYMGGTPGLEWIL